MRKIMLTYLFWALVWSVSFNIIGVIWFLLVTPNPIDYIIFNIVITIICMPIAWLWCVITDYIKIKKNKGK